MFIRQGVLDCPQTHPEVLHNNSLIRPLDPHHDNSLKFILHNPYLARIHSTSLSFFERRAELAVQGVMQVLTRRCLSFSEAHFQMRGLVHRTYREDGHDNLQHFWAVCAGS